MTTRSEFWIGTKMADFRQDEKQSLILLTSGLLLLNRLAGFGVVARKWACRTMLEKKFHYYFDFDTVSIHFVVVGLAGKYTTHSIYKVF
jgi:hypothetical protein